MRNTDLKNPKGLAINAEAVERTVFGRNSCGQFEILHVGATTAEAKAFAAGFALAVAWGDGASDLTPGVGFNSLSEILSDPGFAAVDFRDLFVRQSLNKRPGKLKVHRAKRRA